MQVGEIVTRKNEQIYTAGEVLEIIGDKAIVLWSDTKVKTKIKLSSLQPYVEVSERDKILRQIETNKRIINRRGSTARHIAYLKSEILELQKQVLAI